MPNTLRTNSPRVRIPVDYGRVMGERVPMNREGMGFIRDRAEPRIRYQSLRKPEPMSLPILPAKLRSGDASAYRRPHAHRVACGHLERCEGRTCKTLAERRPAICFTCN